MTGVLLLDKPAGLTSFQAANRVRRSLGLQKIGHTGTLDPMATGVLVLLTNGATRFIEYMPNRRKVYRAGFRLGIVTDTLDMTGKVLAQQPVDVSPKEIESALTQFRGKIMQTPPMVSAIQQGGVRLYELARRGKTVERAPREVEIFRLELVQNGGEFALEVECSAGTYVRSLIDDLGRALGVGGAAMSSLRRTEANGYSIAQCATLEQLQSGNSCAIPMEEALKQYPKTEITAPQAVRFCNGGALDLNRLQLPCKAGTLRVFAKQRFLGLGEIRGEQLAVARLLVSCATAPN
jgi:tRNA pseudouridine55 synthase